MPTNPEIQKKWQDYLAEVFKTVSQDPEVQRLAPIVAAILTVADEVRLGTP